MADSKARLLAKLLDSSGDVVSSGLDNVPASNDASALTTGTLPAARIATGAITDAKLATGISASKITTGTLPAARYTQGATNLNELTDTTVSASDPTISTNPSAVGHLWINSTSGEQFIAIDITAGANDWTNTGEGSGSIQVKDGSTSAKAITSISDFETTNRSSKSAGNTQYLWVSSGGITMQAWFVWLSVNSVLNSYLLIGGMNGGSDFQGNKTATVGTYPSSFPFNSGHSNAIGLVSGNFHLPLDLAYGMAQAGSNYIAGFDNRGSFGATQSTLASWWTDLSNQISDTSNPTSTGSSGYYSKATWSMTSNMALVSTSDKTNTFSSGLIVGYWDNHWFYAEGGHTNAHGMNLHSGGGNMAGDGFIFVR